MKTKKLWALIMTLAMTLALAVPALASTPSPSDATRTIQVAGGNQTGEISVTLGTAGNIILNPYQMEATSGTEKSYHQIFFVPVKCTNNSTFGLKVSAKVTGAKDGSSSQATFVSAVPKDTATEKEVFLYAEFGTSTKDAVPTWLGSYNKSNANQILISDGESDEKVVATLPAASASKANYLWYTFDGAAAKSPTTAWGTNDKVKATVALTLIPTVDAVYPITVVNTTSKTAAGTVALNYDLAPAGKEITVTCTADEEVNEDATATVTAMQGTTKLTVTDNKFTMPAGDVTVTVRWTAPSA